MLFRKRPLIGYISAVLVFLQTFLCIVMKADLLPLALPPAFQTYCWSRLLSCTIPFSSYLHPQAPRRMQYPLPVLPLSRRALPRIPPYFCSVLPPSALPAASVAFVDAVVALPFAADALVWSPHLLKQTPMMPMTPPNWRTMRQPFLRILRWFPTLSRSSRMSSLRKQALLLRWPVQWLRQPSLWLLKQTMRRFLPIFRRRWHWLRPARHLLTLHWQTTQPLF